ncbi:hypothetical protein B0H16DRAFT_380716 [Mycena metata]|uniref:F-box domain-containing protein n=1 Tax=Mycena metata TaxID=1033252 RepID=A0AAD7HHJ8_9AGAR|nr:hypothetical protein B0H16DRAFT_380716 [Mycena metata]
MSPQPRAESTSGPPTQSQRLSLTADRARIAVIKAKILELERENDLLQDRLDSYAYPVLTLPNELVSEIFLHFLPVYPEPPPIIGRSSPNVLGQICRKWREITFQTPALWRAIALSLRNGKRLDQKLRLLELWLKRSGSCLLSIQIDHSLHVSSGTRSLPATLDPFTRALAAHSARWEYFRLYSLTYIFPSITAPLPFLRALTMAPVEPRVNGAPNIDSLVRALHTARLLRDVAVVSWHEHCISLYPWSQLTRFIAREILPHLCVDILTQAPNLTYCDVFVYGSGVTPTARNITLPYLSTLILRGILYMSMSWTFLDVFTFPALRELQVTEPILQDDPIGVLKSLVSRSGCSIQVLYLEIATVPLDEYRMALPAVGTIVKDVLDIHDAWAFPQDEENDSPSEGDSDVDGGSSAGSDTDESGESSMDAANSEDNEDGSHESE